MQASPLHSAPPPPLRGSARGRTSVSEAWECDGEATALTQLAVDLNLPPVLLRDALSNGEAQARTWSEARIFCPVEALENPGQLARGNAHARISHRDGDGSSVQASTHFYSSIGRGIFEGVVQQDQKQLL